MKHIAFVLKRLYPSQYKVALFERAAGRIDALCFKESLIPGSLVEYRLDRNGSLRIIDTEILYMPLHWGKHDLMFMHHILELCYYFTPLNSSCAAIFEMLSLMSVWEEQIWSVSMKKIFIAKLLMVFGLYPQTVFVTGALFRKLLYCSPRTMLTLDIDENTMAYIDQWIRQTISEHPLVPQFKTAIFLAESG
jgi:hypothetical protein